MNENKETLRETKQKNSILRRRNDTLVEQLSNAKHESDMSEAMLKRKERRVSDLEEQLTDAMSKADSLQFKSDGMTKRIKTLQEKEGMAVSECERLKVSYDAIVTAQTEYKRLMDNKISKLEQKLHEFMDDRRETLDNNIDLFKRQEPEIMASYKVVVKNSQRLEEMYAQRQKSVREALITLATATKTHGQKTSIVMAECEDVLKQMNRNEELMSRLRKAENGEKEEEEGEDNEDGEVKVSEVNGVSEVSEVEVNQITEIKEDSPDNQVEARKPNEANQSNSTDEAVQANQSGRGNASKHKANQASQDLNTVDTDNKENIKKYTFPKHSRSKRASRSFKDSDPEDRALEVHKQRNTSQQHQTRGSRSASGKKRHPSRRKSSRNGRGRGGRRDGWHSRRTSEQIE